MKNVSINIDSLQKPNELALFFEQSNIQEGDTLRIQSTRISENHFIGIGILVIVFSAMIYHLRHQLYAEKLLTDIFKNKSIEAIGKEIEEEYGIKIELESMVDFETEQSKWKNISTQQLAKAYSVDEPEYTMNMLNEPNPDYKK